MSGNTGGKHITGTAVNHGTVDDQFSLDLEGHFTNHGTVTIAATRPLTVSNNGTFVQAGGSLDIAGTFTQTGGAAGSPGTNGAAGSAGRAGFRQIMHFA